MDKIWQEFYCGHCDGYFRLKLNIAINHEVEMVCPNCGHKHRRCIKNGIIYEQGRFQNNYKEEICPPKSAYSKEPLTKKMTEKDSWKKRDGIVIEKPEDMSDNPIAASIIRERWFELYGS